MLEESPAGRESSGWTIARTFAAHVLKLCEREMGGGGGGGECECESEGGIGEDLWGGGGGGVRWETEAKPLHY